MSEGPVAATLSEIKAAFPKAKAESILNWLDKGLPMASVASAAVEEMMTENAALKAEVEELKAAAAAKAAEGEEEVVEEEVVEAKAKARGVAPVARATGGTAKAAKPEWDAAVEAELKASNGNRQKAILAAGRKNPELRVRMLAEVNSAR